MYYDSELEFEAVGTKAESQTKEIWFPGESRALEFPKINMKPRYL